MKEKWLVRIHLTPGKDGREMVEQEFDNQDDAVRFGSSAATSAYAVSHDGEAIWYPLHRIDHVSLHRVVSLQANGL